MGQNSNGGLSGGKLRKSPVLKILRSNSRTKLGPKERSQRPWERNYSVPSRFGSKGPKSARTARGGSCGLSGTLKICKQQIDRNDGGPGRALFGDAALPGYLARAGSFWRCDGRRAQGASSRTVPGAPRAGAAATHLSRARGTGRGCYSLAPRGACDVHCQHAAHRGVVGSRAPGQVGTLPPHVQRRGGERPRALQPSVAWSVEGCAQNARSQRRAVLHYPGHAA
ncbi:hypothetical protein T492DRAFT_45155 [Pavlovales sp. CCMP2436]|nr:hypothetical protein T492DRAFT_45155 [Pavlovales sp. CCMP2436]